MDQYLHSHMEEVAQTGDKLTDITLCGSFSRLNPSRGAMLISKHDGKLLVLLVEQLSGHKEGTTASLREGWRSA